MCLSSWQDGSPAWAPCCHYIPFFTSSWIPSSSMIRGVRNSRSFTYISRPYGNEKWLIRSTLHIICSAELLTNGSAPLLCWQLGGHHPKKLPSELVTLLWLIPSHVCPASPVHLQGPPKLCRASTHFSSIGDKGRNFTLDWQVICILQAAEKKTQSGELDTSHWGHRWGPRSAEARRRSGAVWTLAAAGPRRPHQHRAALG